MENFKARALMQEDLVPVNYWDYIQLDVLLNLQKPKTNFSDEKIFIGYHQVTELVLMLALHELAQLTDSKAGIPSPAIFIEKLGRLHRYVELCAKSFDVMMLGMDPQQYNTFRHALAPASGFQSFQFRKMEFLATDLHNLVRKEARDAFASEENVAKLIPELYWRAAGLDRKTGERTLTLRQFETQYGTDFHELAQQYKSCNIWQQYLKLKSAGISEADEFRLREALRKFDWLFNQEWPLVHYNAASRYLDATDAEGTGGSKWKEYLHPRFQKRLFYPSLWSEAEIANWGELHLEFA